MPQPPIALEKYLSVRRMKGISRRGEADRVLSCSLLLVPVNRTSLNPSPLAADLPCTRPGLLIQTPLPPVKEAFPPGGGATGQKSEFEGSLKGVSVIDGFENKVQQCASARDDNDHISRADPPSLRATDIASLPTKPIPAHPSNPYPLFLTVARDLPGQVKSAQDVQQCACA